MLERKTLKPSNGECPLAQLREILGLHQTVQSGLHNFSDQRIDETILIHSFLPAGKQSSPKILGLTCRQSSQHVSKVSFRPHLKFYGPTLLISLPASSRLSSPAT